MADRARVVMVGGVGLFSVLAIGASSMDLDAGIQLLLGGGGRLLALVALATLTAAALARRPAWAASLAAACAGTLAMLGVMVTQQETATTPWGDTLMPKGIPAVTARAYRPALLAGEADLALMRWGLSAAQQGRPLPAPEGGFLVPREVAQEPASPARWRYVAAPSVAPAVWETALRRQEKVDAEMRQASAIAPTARPDAWLKVGGLFALANLGFALLVNLAALAARRLLGARP